MLCGRDDDEEESAGAALAPRKMLCNKDKLDCNG